MEEEREGEHPEGEASEELRADDPGDAGGREEASVAGHRTTVYWGATRRCGVVVGWNVGGREYVEICGGIVSRRATISGGIGVFPRSGDDPESVEKRVDNSGFPWITPWKTTSV
jgi:hypothetical protein